jgi:hypothetical protein
MKLNPDLERYRQTKGTWKSSPGKPFGLFYVPFRTAMLKVIACDGLETGWDHVSVSLPNRCPNWEEMCHVKSLFWDDEDTVMQFHPPKSEYVNNHPYCLHLWRPVGKAVELPPSILVGIKQAGVMIGGHVERGVT